MEFHDPERYVKELLELELRERKINRINRVVKTAGFQAIKTLEDFVWNQNIELPLGLTREYGGTPIPQAGRKPHLSWYGRDRKNPPRHSHRPQRLSGGTADPFLHGGVPGQPPAGAE